MFCRVARVLAEYSHSVSNPQLLLAPDHIRGEPDNAVLHSEQLLWTFIQNTRSIVSFHHSLSKMLNEMSTFDPGNLAEHVRSGCAHEKHKARPGSRFRANWASSLEKICVYDVLINYSKGRCRDNRTLQCWCGAAAAKPCACSHVLQPIWRSPTSTYWLTFGVSWGL